ncbi:hypothetical protein MBM_06256 [Drepanopeziza brunnea f. sp. 'multigermtubi' MB_m1]|uniref:Uncharacterized protein n=1 Tax=Marssonina brunnea f. sp. multigermtubi (strain MB_m1) TaxID=1072389 RepID=K1X4Q2_MARBU|nr:uncharacterized protein MBM_06256 [Drepanopeziza brunnea f. sp. 'multigermtubi' MB_m1]EKD15628.1 hypothetical protein MBM_06256 [Drepanopeziza brunnea f. sp. 'multigermtubi' MB_m1]
MQFSIIAVFALISAAYAQPQYACQAADVKACQEKCNAAQGGNYDCVSPGPSGCFCG